MGEGFRCLAVRTSGTVLDSTSANDANRCKTVYPWTSETMPVKRPLGHGSVLLAVAFGLASAYVGASSVDGEFWGIPTDVEIGGVTFGMLGSKLLGAVAIVFAGYGLYLLTKRALHDRTPSKRRQHDVRNVLRLGFGVATVVALLGVATDQWVGVLFSLGVVGFAVTFALQQPLFSLIGWLYIMVKRPYQVGDRVAIEGSKGDVVEVDFLVTTLWEINGDLVSSNQPSGRIITLPNSVVLSSHVKNYTREDFPFVWNELSIQVAYETDLEYAQDLMREEADDFLGDEMAAASPGTGSASRRRRSNWRFRTARRSTSSRRSRGWSSVSGISSTHGAASACGTNCTGASWSRSTRRPTGSSSPSAGTGSVTAFSTRRHSASRTNSVTMASSASRSRYWAVERATSRSLASS